MQEMNSPFEGQWIGRADANLGEWRRPTLPAPLFRKRFELAEPDPEAELSIAGLGYSEIYLNGEKIGDEVLSPPPAVFDRHYYFRRFPVGKHLRRGVNVLGVMLGNGWYNCQTTEIWHFDKATWRDYPKLRCRLNCHGRPVVVSDPSWIINIGAITFDSLRGGEYYDARREFDWLTPDDTPEREAVSTPSIWEGEWPAVPSPDDFRWKYAAVVPGPGGLPLEATDPPCRILATLPMTPADGNPNLYRAPYNLAGWTRIRVRGEAGSTVTIRTDEHLTSDRTHLDQSRNGRFIEDGTFQLDRYTLKGDPAGECWEPRFTYHGFQYAELELTGTVAVDAVDARVVGTDFIRHGNLDSADPRLAELETAGVRTVQGNFVAIPTDCPHREKNGWTNEAYCQAETLLYTFDAAASYARWLDTLADTQRPNGQLSAIAPSSGYAYSWVSGPLYSLPFIELPYKLYCFTGDKGYPAKHYAAMRRACDFLETLDNGGAISYGLGDWLGPEDAGRTPARLVATAAMCRILGLLARNAEILGHTADAADYAARTRQRIRDFNRLFYRGDGEYVGETSTAMALPLYWHLAEAAERPRIAARLAEHVRQRRGRVDYGTVGSVTVPRALCETGLPDLAFALMTQPEYPGYRYWFDHYGATTFFERWTDATSLNHGAFVDIIAAMYRYFAGFRHDWRKPGPRHLIVEPMAPGPLEHFTGRYRGYESKWKRIDPERILHRITVPENAAAELRLAGEVTELPPGTHEFLIPANRG